MSDRIELLLAFIVHLANALALSVSSILFVNSVLHWKVRKIKWTIIIISALSLICAGIMTAAPLWATPRNENIKAIHSDFILPIFFLISWIVLIIRTEGRGWKRAIVSWVAIGIVDAISARFTYLPNYLEAQLNDVTLSTLIHITASALVLTFVWFLARISKKQVNHPIRLGTVVLLSTLLFIFDEVILSEIEVITTSPVTLSLDIAANEPFYISLDILLYFVALIVAFFIFAQKSENTYYKEMLDANANYLKAQAQYYEAVDQSNTEIRKIRHDMRNNLTVLTLLLENQDYPQMKAYLEEINASVQSSDTGIRNGNSIADIIIFDKTNQAAAAGCPLTIEGQFSYAGMNATDTCAIIGNILDNAIESARCMPSDKREIRLKFSKTDHFFLITENNYSHKLSIADNNVIATSKKDKMNHGFGLLNIKEAVARYNGETQISCEPAEAELYMFRIEIILPLPL